MNTVQKPKSLRALVSVRAVYVDCPHCGQSMYEPATPNDTVPWGKTEACWSCTKPVKLPRSPFNG